MPVGMISTPCLSNRWLPFAFGILGDPNTCPFRDSPYTSHRSMRLFFHGFLIALNESLSDTQTGIAVGMVAHLALRAQAERGARSVALHRFSLVVANDVGVAAMAFSTRVARVHAAGDQTPGVPRLIFAIAEDAAFHEVRRVSYCSGANTCPFRAGDCPDAQRQACSPHVLARTGQCER